MRLIDANKLIIDGWVLKRYQTTKQGKSFEEMMLIDDVPTAYDVDILLEENSMLRAKIKYLEMRGESND